MTRPAPAARDTLASGSQAGRSQAGRSQAGRSQAARSHAGRSQAGAPVAALLRLLDACIAAGVSRNALLLRLSRLPPAMTRPHHLRLAQAALEPLLRADRAQSFRLSSDPAGDVVVAWRGEADAALQASLSAIGRLFADLDLPDLTDLVETLDLPRHQAILLRSIDAARPPAPAAPAMLPALDTVALATLEARLARADVSRFARRRDVCSLGPDGRFVLRWEKRFLSVEELSATLAPDHAAQADPWLFRRLTRTLDHRMMALLAAPGELREAGPFALNLNVGSILDPAFLRFDAALPAALRGRVVLDLLPADVLGDPAAFLFARDFARARGYRLLLRSVSAELIDVLPLGLSGLDLLQLRWSPALASVTALPSDPGATVLARADTPEAVAWGRARGIQLFAGRLAVRGARAPSAARASDSRERALGEAVAPA